MKKSTVVILVAIVAGISFWQRTGSDVDIDFLRGKANEVTTTCAEYYDALPAYALSGRGASAEEDLGNVMEAFLLAVVDINITVAFNDDLNLYPEVYEVADRISRPLNYTETQQVDLLRVTLKEECRKWRAFARLSDGDIRAYFKIRNDLLTDGISKFCDTANAEVLQIPTQVEIEIRQCEVQFTSSGDVLVVGLNNWLEWIDFDDEENVPDSEGLNSYVFDFPLQLIINSFRLSSVSPNEFELIIIAFRDEERTAYELNPADIQQALTDTRQLEIILQKLQEKMKISSL